MRLEKGHVILENKTEVELLQNVVEIGISNMCMTDEEKEIGKRFSEILEEMLRGETK